MSGKTTERGHQCCACFTHNDLPCCNPGHADLTKTEWMLIWRAIIAPGRTAARVREAVERVISARMTERITEARLDGRCASCGEPATTTSRPNGRLTLVCLRHLNVWRTPAALAHPSTDPDG